MIDLLRKLVATPSVSRQEARIADVVSGELAAHGLRGQRHGNNVWCEIGDAERPRLLLNSHLDTVPPGENWSADPWTPRLVEDRVIGLGANDAKGCVAAMMQAAFALKSALEQGQRLGGTVVLALTAEEETTGQGLATILEHLKHLDAGIVGEPTGLTPMIAQRGLLILRCVAHGRSAHPANTPPDSADNAISTAVADVQRLHKFAWGSAHPLLGRCHAHVTMIQGGVSRNVIPDQCEFFVDVRTTPLEDHAALVERLRAALKCEVLVHSDRLAPVQTAADEPIVRAAVRAVGDVRPSGSPAMSDMVFLRGIPAVKIGPGDTARSHTPNEYIRIDELKAGATAYEGIVRNYFLAPGAARQREAVAAGGLSR